MVDGWDEERNKKLDAERKSLFEEVDGEMVKFTARMEKEVIRMRQLEPQKKQIKIFKALQNTFVCEQRLWSEFFTDGGSD